ncbi:MAG: cell division protein FtsZ [Rhodospirillales bacterium]|nr:cell division protein FtsZ [Rhodospirillales bacterium]
MTINFSIPTKAPVPELKPHITVIGVGGAGCNAVNNMIRSHLEGVDFVVANTDAQALAQSISERRVQLGVTITQGLGAGSRPDIGRIASEESLEEIVEQLRGSNMVFIAAGMGGGTGTGAAPVIARAAREQGILTVGVVTKPFHFEGGHRMRIAEKGISELEQFVDTLIIIPNQNLFRVANEKTTFADAFKMADDVLQSGVRGVTDLMVCPGQINLDFADIRAVMSEMGKAMMGTGEASGERRALEAAEAAISNPLLDDATMKGARGILINVTGGDDMTLFEVDEAVNRIRSEVDPEAGIIFGTTFDNDMNGVMRVSVVATGMDIDASAKPVPTLLNLSDAVSKQRPTEQKIVVGNTAVAAMPDAETEAHHHRYSLGNGSTGGQPAAAQSAALHEAASTDEAAAPSNDVQRDAFIPPQPVDAANAAAPQAGSGHVGEDRPAKHGVAQLIARVTGAGRATRPTIVDSGTERGRSEPHPLERPRRLGGVKADERLPVSEPTEDLLDIPAFLRRQAN